MDATARKQRIVAMIALVAFALPLFATAQTTGNRVYLLWEADTYTHPFYRGRALPTADATVRIVADARLVSASGSLIPADSLTYTWSVNGRVMQNLSGTGRSVITLPGPALYGALNVSVEVATSDHSVRAIGTARIEAEEPVLALYEDHALAGVLYRKALTSGDTLSSSPATVLAVPYFLSRPSSPFDITYAWRIGSTPVSADSGRPNMITLSADDGRVKALSLSVSHKNKQFQDARRTWQLILNESARNGNPFTSQ